MKNTYIQAGLLFIVAIGALVYGKAQAEVVTISHNAKRLSNQYSSMENVWNKLSSQQKNAVLEAIEKNKQEDMDDVNVSIVREYDASVDREPAQAVMIYLKELPESKQHYLLVEKAGLSEPRYQEIVAVTGSKPEESFSELMMYNDRDFFNPLD
jgi:hypothetical protein